MASALDCEKTLPALQARCPSSYGDKVIAGLSQMQEQSMMTDFTIKVVNSKDIPVHKVLLNVASDYFSAMLTSGMKEANDAEVHLHSLSAHAVESAVDYMYGREITIQWEEIEDYMDVIEIFQLLDLKNQLEENMTKHVAPNNALQLCRLAAKYGLTNLKAKAKATVASYFVLICGENKDMTLSDMLDLLSDKDLRNVQNNAKLKAIIEWVICQEEDRKDAFAELVQCIDLKQCSASYLSYVLDTYEGRFINNVSVYAEISKSMASSLVKAKDICGGNSFLILGGWDQNNALVTTIYRVDMKCETVEVAGELPDELLKFHPARCVTPSGALFSASGGTNNDDSSKTSDCIMYDVKTKSLSRLPSVPSPRLAAGAAAFASKVYMIGGEHNYKNLSCFDLNSQLWKKCQDLVSGVEHPIVCSVGKNIYALTQTWVGEGSYYKEGDPIIFQCYNTEEDEWSVLTSPPSHVTDTDGACVVVVWANIYIIGGQDKLCISYSTTEDVWRTHEQPSAVHRDSAAALVDGKIVLCGGSFSDTIEVFDLYKNTWHTSTLKLPQNLNFPMCLTE